MRICIFGTYESNYLRNRILIQALTAEKIDFIEVNHSVPPFISTSTIKKLSIYLRMIKNLIRNLRKATYDLILVLYPGIQSIMIAKWFGKKKIIFDPFISVYEAAAFEYKTIKPHSILGRFYYNIEKCALNSADLLIADTFAQADYYRREFGVKKPIHRIFVGADTETLQNYQKGLKNDPNSIPLKKNANDKLLVSFVGNYIPLQGLDFIIESAKYLGEDTNFITYEIIGGTDSQREEYIHYCQQNDIHNIRFIPPVPFEILPKYVEQSDIQLGIFGTGEKTQRVIPNKVYYALAAGKPIITADTPAIRELLIPDEEFMGCAVGDANSLAEAILRLYQNPELRFRIANGGKKKFDSLCTKEVIGAELIKIFNQILS
jgi:glycosyltransferase involved in cell wall biosynthesis